MAAMVDARLTRYLLDAGATEADIEQAAVEGWIPVLVLDRVLMPGRPAYDVPALAAAGGTEPETLRRLWRAIGFPDVPDGLALFTETDVEAIRRLLRRDTGGFGTLEFEAPERIARVVSAALARIAAYEVELFANSLETMRAAGVGDEEIGLALLEVFRWDDLGWLIDYAHRLQLRAAAWRRLTRPSERNTVEMAIGFADLAGYTELAEELDDRQLAELLDRFEVLAFDTVAELGGRVVKTIGDAIMFVGPPDAVASIALALRDRAKSIEDLPAVRLGIAFGSVLSRDGDYFGPVVNLASRITNRARPGTILTSAALRDVLSGDPRFTWRSLPARRVRGIGEVKMYSLRHPRTSRSGA
jgi:adenylate cyclase